MGRVATASRSRSAVARRRGAPRSVSAETCRVTRLFCRAADERVERTPSARLRVRILRAWARPSTQGPVPVAATAAAGSTIAISRASSVAEAAAILGSCSAHRSRPRALRIAPATRRCAACAWETATKRRVLRTSRMSCAPGQVRPGSVPCAWGTSMMMRALNWVCHTFTASVFLPDRGAGSRTAPSTRSAVGQMLLVSAFASRSVSFVPGRPAELDPVLLPFPVTRTAVWQTLSRHTWPMTCSQCARSIAGCTGPVEAGKHAAARTSTSATGCASPRERHARPPAL